MTTTTFADRVALGKMTVEWFVGHRAGLTQRGVQPDYWTENMKNGIEGTVHANETQETLKAQLKTATKDVERWDRQMYALVSGAINVGIGAYGKGSPEAKQLATFRSKLHRPQAQKGETTKQ